MNERTRLQAYLDKKTPTPLILMGQRGLPLLKEAEWLCSKLLHTEEGRVETHPDFLYVRSDKALGVDEANLIVERAMLKPAINDRLIILVDVFDTFTVAAQNKLLKLLEESTTATVVAVCYKDTVLPTIQSRCQIVEFIPLSKEAFNKATGQADNALYYVSGGLPEAEPEKGMLEIFRGVSKALREKDMKGLLSVLHLVREKDEENFFVSHREYVRSLLAFIGSELKDNSDMSVLQEVLPLLSEGVERCGHYTYTKDDFFLLMARVGEVMGKEV